MHLITSLPARIVLCCGTIGPAAFAKAQEQTWVQQFGTTAYDEARAVAADDEGGTYVGGRTQGDLGDSNAGSFDAWLARYDASGGRMWIVQMGTADVDEAHNLAATSDGVFVAGITYGSLENANLGEADVWVARHDADGNQLWIRQFGTARQDTVGALIADGSGGVYIAGSTGGDLGGPNAGSMDAWIARYDGTGAQTWVRQFGSNRNDLALDLAPDGESGLYVNGTTLGSLGGTHLGVSDAWLARYDATGERTWIRQFGTAEDDQCVALAPDGAGGVSVGGSTWGDFGGESEGNYDAWIARYDGAGAQTWVRQFGTSSLDVVTALASDGSGGVFAGGYTEGTLGGQHAGGTDPWLANFDHSGAQQWITQFGTSQPESLHGLSTNGSDRLFAGGGTAGDLEGSNSGSFDAWLVRYSITDSDEVLPDSFTRIRGLPVSGVLNDLFLSDDSRLVTRPDVFRTTSVPPVQVQVTGTSPADEPTEIRITVESHASVNNILQRVLVFNDDTSVFDLLDSRVLPTSDATVEIVISIDPGRYVEDATGSMRILTQYNAVAFSIAPTWHARQDRVFWTVTR